MESMSDQDFSPVCKRFLINCPALCQSLGTGSRLSIISPSVEILKNGPTLGKETEVRVSGHCLNYRDSIAIVDGFDLTVASVQSELKTAKCIPGFFLTKIFYFAQKHIPHTVCNTHPTIKHNSHVDCCGRYLDYSYEMVDRLMAQQLWPGNGAPPLFADIEFLVSGVVFKAHRAIVSARSAVFAAMFASGMRESGTGRVEINDVLPETFADFLKFVYTGQLGTPCFTNIELGYCADKYEVKTLGDLCNGSTARRDFDAFKAAFPSYGDLSFDKVYENDASLFELVLYI